MGDITAEKVFLDKNGTVKIADYGVSELLRFAAPEQPEYGVASWAVSPDVLGKATVTGQVDIWNLGVLIL